MRIDDQIFHGSHLS